MKKRTWLNDWIFYWGSKDERVRAGADRAGHVGFMVLIAGMTVLVFALTIGLPLDRLGTAIAVVALLLLAVTVYCGLTVAKGLVFLDGARQRKALARLLAASPIVLGLTGYLVGSASLAKPESVLIATVAYAVGGTAVAALIIWLMHRGALRRAASAAAEPENPGEIREHISLKGVPMNKIAQAIASFAFGLVFVGVSITFYFSRYDSIATYLMVLFSGAIVASGIINGALVLIRRAKDGAKQ
jgi:hypothetical protein